MDGELLLAASLCTFIFLLASHQGGRADAFQPQPEGCWREVHPGWIPGLDRTYLVCARVPP